MVLVLVRPFIWFDSRTPPMKKKLQKLNNYNITKVIFFSFLILNIFFIKNSYASTLINTSFEDCSTGALTGSCGWYGSTNATIDTSFPFFGNNYIKLDHGNANNLNAWASSTLVNSNIESFGTALLTIHLYTHTNTTHAFFGLSTSTNANLSNNFTNCSASLETGTGGFGLFNGATGTRIGTTTLNEWHKVEVFFDFINRQCQLNLDDTGWSSLETMNNNRTGISYIAFSAADTVDGDYTLVDNVSLDVGVNNSNGSVSNGINSNINFVNPYDGGTFNDFDTWNLSLDLSSTTPSNNQRYLIIDYGTDTNNLNNHDYIALSTLLNNLQINAIQLQKNTNLVTSSSSVLFPYYARARVTELSTSTSANVISSGIISFNILPNGLAPGVKGNSLQCGTLDYGCTFWQYFMNAMQFIMLPTPSSVNALLNSFLNFRNVFPFSIYFNIVGNFETVITNSNATTTNTLSINIPNLNGTTKTITVLTSSTLKNVLTQNSVTNQFGTTPTCNSTCATTAVNNIFTVLRYIIWIPTAITAIMIIV